MIDWKYFDKFEELEDKYLPVKGEGETKASQIVTAVCKLVYKWYNDGDCYDNTGNLEGWCNDLSSYANWLARHTDAGVVLNRIFECYTEDDYSYLLKDLADMLLIEDYLAEENKIPKVDSIYTCEGRFKFEEHSDEEDFCEF